LGIDLKLHEFLTMEVGGDEWSDSSSVHLTPEGRAPHTHDGGKSKILNRAGNRTPFIQPIARHFTDGVISVSRIK
jgi:hypothetical protein